MRNKQLSLLLGLILMLTVVGAPLVAAHDEEGELGGGR